ncbi:hypothetical protein VTO42DRAFT_8731 [Malbranchea cinnamomea]
MDPRPHAWSTRLRRETSCPCSLPTFNASLAGSRPLFSSDLTSLLQSSANEPVDDPDAAARRDQGGSNESVVLVLSSTAGEHHAATITWATPVRKLYISLPTCFARHLSTTGLNFRWIVLRASVKTSYPTYSYCFLCSACHQTPSSLAQSFPSRSFLH